jgi:hypothetical protein
MNLQTLITTAIFVLPIPLKSAETIDRHALVTRHHPVNLAFDPDSTLSVGNGGFAFGADITGLQTFDREHHLKGIPVETLSRWCWHSAPNPQGHDLAAASKTYLQGDGRKEDYPTEASTPAGDWMRKNPHHMPLGRIRFVTGENTELVPADIASPEQTLELWTGESYVSLSELINSLDFDNLVRVISAVMQIRDISVENLTDQNIFI